MPFLSCCPSPETTAVALMFYAPHSCVARCMMPRRWRAHLSPVSCSLASTVQTFPATSSICSAMLDMFVVCSQSRSYTFSVCKIVVCVCVGVRALMWVCVRARVHVCVHLWRPEEDSVYVLLHHTLPVYSPETRSLADPAARLAARRSQQCCLYFTPRSRA